MTMTMIILAGIPGSGKTTLANMIAEESKAAKEHIEIVSADDFFTDRDGTYRFAPSGLTEAHARCFGDAIDHHQSFHKDRIRHLREGAPDPKGLLIVDNTNTTATEMAPYILLGRSFAVEPLPIVLLPDPVRAASQNKHGVPKNQCLTMHRRLERLAFDEWPPFWPKPEVFMADEWIFDEPGKSILLARMLARIQRRM